MCIPSIRCGLPFSEVNGENRTCCSLITRISLIAISGIMLLVGILALSGISGFNALGMGGGAAFIVVGGLCLFAGLCLRLVKETEVKKNKQTEENTLFVDPRVSESSSSLGSSTDAEGKVTISSKTYCSLESFLASDKPGDRALRQRLTQELGIKDLNQRFRENFANKKVGLALPLSFENEIRDDEFIFKLLKLIYLSVTELLAQPLKEVIGYGLEEQNIVSLRLMLIDEIPRSEPDTFGAFLHFTDEIFSVSYNLYPLFTQAQVAYFLQKNTSDIAPVEELFPHSRHFSAMRSIATLSKLPIELVNRVLGLLKPNILWSVIEIRGEELNYDLMTENQCRELLPTSFLEESNSTEKMEKLPIEILNKLLPKMDSQLKLIPHKHLKNSQLNIKSLSETQIKRMFPTNPMDKDNSIKRMNALHSDNHDYIKSKVKFDQQLFL